MLQPIHFWIDVEKIFPEMYELIVYRFRDKRQKHQLRFWRLSRNRLTINGTTHTFLKRSFRDLSKNVWVVALIVYRFRDKRQKRQHRRLNSYRGDYINFTGQS